MLRMFAVMCEKVPPPGPRIISESTSKNVPAAPALVVLKVPPSTVTVEPARTTKLFSDLRFKVGIENTEYGIIKAIKNIAANGCSCLWIQSELRFVKIFIQLAFFGLVYFL